MKGLTIPFSIYDFFGVLFPGGLGIFGLYMFANPALSKKVHQSLMNDLILIQINGDFTIISVLLISSYLMGIILNAVSDLIIDTPANRRGRAHIKKDLEDSEVKVAISRIFGNTFLESSYCYKRTFVMIESIVSKNIPYASMMASKFIALSKMFESLILSVFIVLIALLKEQFSGNFNFTILSILSSLFSSLVLVILFGILMCILFKSYRKFKEMWSRNITMAFVAWVKTGNDKLPNKKIVKDTIEI